MADAMRVFLAVDLGDAMSDAACAWGRAMAATLGPAASALTWVPPARIHITLRFFGELPADRVEALGRTLTVGPWAPAFAIGFGGAGTYPPSGRPRVLWLGISTGREALVGLHDALAHRLASARGIAGTSNAGAGAGDAFSPHVTIARVRRDPPPGLGRALRDACVRTPSPDARADVHELTLFESVLKSRGPAYVPLVRVPLEVLPQGSGTASAPRPASNGTPPDVQ